MNSKEKVINYCCKEGILPPFSSFTLDIIKEVFPLLLCEVELELSSKKVYWDGKADPNYGDLDLPSFDKLNKFWSVVEHLLSVKRTDELDSFIEEGNKKITEVSLTLSQSLSYRETLLKIRNSKEFETMPQSQKAVIELLVKNDRLSGACLGAIERERLNVIEVELETLSSKFTANMIKGESAAGFYVSDTDGLPLDWKIVASEEAKEEFPNANPEDGPYKATLTFTNYTLFMSHCANRDLREKLFRQKNLLGKNTEDPSLDNLPIAKEMLQLRHEAAKLLGFTNHIPVALYNNIYSESDIRTLLKTIFDKSLCKTKQEIELLSEFSSQLTFNTMCL